MASWLQKNVQYILCVLALLILFHGTVKASNDSLLQSLSIGFFGFNDNNPIDGALSGFEDRRRDDHGLTLLAGYHIGAELNLFKEIKSSIRFTNQSALYTRGLGTTTTLQKGDPLYGEYEYLLEKHPDWTGLHVNDQVSFEKNVKELKMINAYKNLRFGLLLRYSRINSSQNQAMADFQRSFHRITKSRNFYHVPFTDSSVFLGKRFTYFSFTPSIGIERAILKRDKWQIDGGVTAKMWYNSSSDFGIPEFSPEINASILLGYGKSFGSRQRKIMVYYSLTYEPNEIVQRFSDPGTDGFQYLGLEINFRSKDALSKSHYLLYSIRPYAVYLPLGLNDDSTIDYVPPSNDLRFIEGILNFSVSLRFN